MSSRAQRANLRDESAAPGRYSTLTAVDVRTLIPPSQESCLFRYRSPVEKASEEEEGKSVAISIGPDGSQASSS